MINDARIGHVNTTHIIHQRPRPTEFARPPDHLMGVITFLSHSQK